MYGIRFGVSPVVTAGPVPHLRRVPECRGCGQQRVIAVVGAGRPGVQQQGLPLQGILKLRRMGFQRGQACTLYAAALQAFLSLL